MRGSLADKTLGTRHPHTPDSPQVLSPAALSAAPLPHTIATGRQPEASCGRLDFSRRRHLPEAARLDRRSLFVWMHLRCMLAHLVRGGPSSNHKVQFGQCVCTHNSQVCRKVPISDVPYNFTVDPTGQARNLNDACCVHCTQSDFGNIGRAIMQRPWVRRTRTDLRSRMPSPTPVPSRTHPPVPLSRTT